MSEQVLIWLKKDIEGTYFVSGKYFYNQKIGDIATSKAYSAKEKQLTKVIVQDNMNLPLTKLKSFITSECKKKGFIADIEVEL